MKRFLVALSFLGWMSPSHAAFEGLARSEDPITIEAEREIVCDEKTHRCDAYGGAVATRDDLTIHGDHLSATFDPATQKITFLEAKGHVRIHTAQESAFGDDAQYDALTDKVHLTGADVRLHTPKYIITAKDFLDYAHGDKKAVLKGDALIYIKDKDQYISADTLTAHFADSGSKDASKERLTSATAEGHVLVSTKDEKVTGDHATYQAATDEATMNGHVTLVKGENVIVGERAQVNLTTHQAEIDGEAGSPQNLSPSPRTRGLIYPKDVKTISKQTSFLQK